MSDRKFLKTVLFPVGLVIAAGEEVKDGAVKVTRATGVKLTEVGDVHRGKQVIRRGQRDMLRQAGAAARVIESHNQEGK